MMWDLVLINMVRYSVYEEQRGEGTILQYVYSSVYQSNRTTSDVMICLDIARRFRRLLR